MLIRGANSAITRENGATVLDVAELLHLLSRSERLRLIRMCERYNDDEQRAKLTPRPPKSTPITPRNERP